MDNIKIHDKFSYLPTSIQRSKMRYREKYNESRREYNRAHSAYIKEIKTNLGCALCGTKTKILMFHHINPQNKKFELYNSSKSLKNIHEEMLKCVVVCVSCHSKMNHHKCNIEYLLKGHLKLKKIVLERINQLKSEVF